MWLYLPSTLSNSALASACSEQVSAPDLSIWESMPEPFATWSGKPLLPPSLSRLWKREPLFRRLSGLTCSPSTAEACAEQWMASLLASRARTSALPADAPGLMANGLASSSGSSTLPTIAVRGSSFWRTSQASLLPPPPLWTKPKATSKSERPPVSWENWPTAGGMRNGSLFQRPMLERITRETAGSASLGAWPTPDCNTSTYSNGHMGQNIREAASQWLTPNVPNVPNGGRSVSAELVASKGMTEDGEKKTVGLESQTKHWGTPQARDYRSPDSPDSPDSPNYQRKLREGYTIDLNSQAVAWPTPRATDGTKGGPNQAGSKGDLMLPSAAAQWPTPTSSQPGGTAEAHVARKLKSMGRTHATVTDLGMVAQQFLPVLARPTPAARDAKGANSSDHVTTNGSGRMHMDQLPNFVQHHFLHPDHPTQSGADSSTPVVSVHGKELSPTTRPEHVLGRLRLNPAFACWLMGWPFWWTNPGITSSVKSEMVLYRSRLRWHLCCLLGEQDSFKGIRHEEL